MCLLDISGKTSPCDALKKIKTKTFNLYIKLPLNDLKWNNETKGHQIAHGLNLNPETRWPTGLMGGPTRYY